MIIHGSRMYGRKNKIHSWGYCEHCNKYLRQTSYKGRKWNHINFIPIFPEGPHVYVIKECKKCSIGLHVKMTDLPVMIEDIEDDVENAMKALHNEQESFVVNGEDGEKVAQSCVDTLIGAIEILYCTGNDEAVNELLTALDKDNYRKIYCVVKGKLLELQGKIDEAVIFFEQAVKNYPDDENAYWLLAAALHNSGKLKEAREVYENLLEISTEKTDVLFILLDVYEELKEYPHMTEAFERCFEDYPEFAKQKKFVKRYKKACKKAGTKPKLELITTQ